MKFIRMKKRLLVVFALYCTYSVNTLALPPEHEIQRLLQSTSMAISQDDMTKAAQQLERIQQLGVEPPAIYYYYQGKVFQFEKRYIEAKSMLETYVVREGSEGEFYSDALNRITAVEEAKAEQDSSVTVTPLPVSSAMKWQPKSDDDYLAGLRQLYLADNDINALVTHINTLLVENPYYGTRIQNRDKRTGVDFRIDVTPERALQVKKKEYKGESGPLLDVSTMDVYGVDPIIQYGCEFERFVCWLYHPVIANQRWILLDRNDAIAEEVSRAVSRLIRLLQKGSQE